MTAHQDALWHDTPEDAVRSLVDALGGFKRVGSSLWPALPVDSAGRRLAQCLDAERAEKLTLSELLMLLRLGQQRSVHTAAAFFMEAAGYRAPEPIAPRDAQAELQREFVEAVRKQQLLVQRLERLGGAL